MKKGSGGKNELIGNLGLFRNIKWGREGLQKDSQFCPRLALPR